MTATAGIHHVTAITGDPQRNLDFYAGVLGMRLVKRTVNFDDPHTYHFYFGDGAGTPGTLLTFFPWVRAAAGRTGTGQVAVTSLSVAPEAIGWWLHRFVANGVRHEMPAKRGDELVLAFRAPDGLQLELVGHPAAATREGWAGGGVSPAHAIRGVHSVTLWVAAHDATARALDTLGFRADGEHDGTARFVAGDGAPGAIVDVRAVGGFPKGTDGVGAVHHVAFRAADDAAELALRERVIESGLRPTDVKDRSYFHSVYFREPGGVLFEIATDGPGFATDEPPETLGESLMLPPMYEHRRAELNWVLPPVHLPQAPSAATSAFAPVEP